MRTSDQEHGVNLLARSYSDNLSTVPIKKRRRFMLAESPSPPPPPPHVSSSLPENIDVPQNNSGPESSVSEALSQPASGTTLTRKDLNQPAHHEGLTGPMLQGIGPDMLSDRDTRQAEESTPALLPVTGVVQPLSTKEPVEPSVSESRGEQDVPTETSGLPIVSGNVKSQVAFTDPWVNLNSENISSKQEKSDSCSQNLSLDAREQNIQSKSKDGASKIESSHACRDSQQANESAPTLLPVTGVIQLLSTKQPVELSVSEIHGEHDVPTETSRFPIVSENVKSQLTIKDLWVNGQNGESISTKPEKSDSCSQNFSFDAREQNLQSKLKDGESKIESSDEPMDRFNWDLNTPMDAWPDMLNDSADNKGADKYNSVVECTQNIKLSLSPEQMVNKEPDGVVETVGRLMLGKSAGSSSLSISMDKRSLSISMDKRSNLESCLDLQLKPSSAAESFFKYGSFCPLGKVGPTKEAPLLSLSVKSLPPCPSSGNSKPVACRDVKAEPQDGSSQMNSKDESCRLKSALKHVKSEPHERQESPQRTCPSNPSSSCMGAVKAEAHDDCSQGYHGKKNMLLATQSTEIPLNVAEHVCQVFESRGSDGNLLQKSMQSPEAITLELVTQRPTHDNNEMHPGGNMLIPELNLVQKLVSDDKKLGLFEEPSKLDGVTSASSKPSLSDIKEHMVNVKLETVAQMCSPRVTSADELTVDSFQNDKAAEISEHRIELSDKVLGKPSDSEMESNNAQFDAGALNTVHTSELNNSHEESGVVDAVHKPPSEDNDFEDGELIDVAMQSTVEVLCEEKGGKQLEAADLVCPIDVPVEMPLCTDPKEDETENAVHENAEDSKIHDTETGDTETGNDSQFCHTDELGISTITKLQDSTDGVPMAYSVKKRLGKSVCKMPQVQLKDKGPDGKLNSVRVLGVMTVTEATHDEVSSPQTDNRLDEIPLSNYDESPQNDEGSSSRIRFNSFMRENSRSQKFRDENFRYKSGAFDRSRNTNQHVGRQRSNMMFNSNRLENQNTNEMIADREHVLEQVGNSPGSRFARRMNAPEVALADTSEGPIGNGRRMKRKLTDDEQQNRSHNSVRGRMPNRRGRIGNMMFHHRIKDVSPNGYTRIDDPDFELRAHEDRLMRTLPDDRMVPLVSRACPQYEMDDELIRRERSVSPIHRRGPLPYPESSPRSQLRNHHQWSPPPRRSAEGFSGSPELLRSAPYFPEDMVVRSRCSPPHIADIGPSRGREFPRPGRGMQRNMRRFDMYDPREELFPEELDGSYEFVDSRQRRGVVQGRPFRQCDAPRDDFNDYHGGPPGPFRFCHEDNDGFVERGNPGEYDGFVERGNPGEYDGHVRNRLGGRLRDVDEHEDDYRYRGEPGWRDAGIGGGRLRRRRVERH